MGWDSCLETYTDNMPLTTHPICPTCGVLSWCLPYPAEHEPVKIGACFETEAVCQHCGYFKTVLRKVSAKDLVVEFDRKPMREQPKDTAPVEIKVENKPPLKTLF